MSATTAYSFLGLAAIDLGDDPSAGIGAFASQQVHGRYHVDVTTLPVLQGVAHIDVHGATTAATRVARTRVDEKPFDHPRVRKAMRLAVDTPRVLELVFQDNGLAAEHHHVCPIHPEYEDLPFMSRDVDAAKALLAEAGFPRYVWYKDGGTIFEGRLVNRGIGSYKGYPLGDDEWPDGIESFYAET